MHQNQNFLPNLVVWSVSMYSAVFDMISHDFTVHCQKHDVDTPPSFNELHIFRLKPEIQIQVLPNVLRLAS